MVKNLHANAGEARGAGLIPVLGRSPGVGDGNLLSSILAWRIPWTEEPGGLHTVHGVAKSQTQLSTYTQNTHISVCVYI